MDKTVLNFSEFLDEELNYTKYDNGVCRLEDRWFYYNADDDIIYGCDETPVGDDKLFSFNPTSCTILINGEEKQYDINNPVCLITYDLEKEEVKVYTEDTLDYLKSIGFTNDEFQSQSSRNQLFDLFEKNEDMKYILIYGDQMVASTFDVIEEN